ncbi:MAG: 3',5'-cyclic-AMP phosphodiesterase [Candidatus Thiodiazotropha sp. (ex Lucina aurantia)]|uniref:3',5'-cyclic adenosine monophosphate phosphodiesterase CpdA n=2 Tax=Candidatus Thiodiazotropha TaxID=1913444 RepID=A0A7Z0VNQ6_9GAMM|nr:3',5'-cyclic-AMP phosphodiesterase [Candidatus Thiodiazotropha endolucinida]MBT3011974.1 3',5'-cyclic-AMP phosphodiesterase [Candidatus Thiodiazotropha sp. (ex Lucina pensylvanica)]MBT3025122.1 3',5'-cyclic-AMP phosphodiesterase [Candidatus Thiodiazotropha taylori]MBT3040540.1 3',5'-cyclic-AMP phosphodiesterase [Candidatus Thiodiazotropha sp. (ex Codakia orbicularis)]MBV2104849.1 3',5'-cyclic-AMP phosphodiesterase [Candidatus Thiodiazotropha sp. (ex Lucina aurantia)]MBT3032685.1 3',5'-cycli
MGSSPDNQPPNFKQFPAESLNLLQLTDSHLYADPSRSLLGINTLETFDQVLAQALQETGNPDFILATGDLVHDASDTGYKRLLGRLQLTEIPTYCLPGNHDIPGKMKQILNQDNVHCIPSVQTKGWSLIFLDSTIAKSDGGRIDESQLELLRVLLRAHPDKHTMICMHHHPVPVGSRWMDTMVLENPDAFFKLIDANPQVQAVLCGHIHQAFDTEYRGVRLMGSPSTCVQFIPRVDDFAIDAIPPGYRWLSLQPDGTIRTGLNSLPKIPSGLDLASMGY